MLSKSTALHFLTTIVCSRAHDRYLFKNFGHANAPYMSLKREDISNPEMDNLENFIPVLSSHY